MLNVYEQERMAAGIIGMVESIEDEIIRRTAAQFKLSDTPKDINAWRIGKLQDMGRFRQYTLRGISAQSGKAIEMVDQVLRAAGYEAALDDDALYQTRLEGAPVAVEASAPIQTIIDQTVANAKHYMNLVNTNAIESAQTRFTGVVNQVYLEVNLGITSYDAAVRKATAVLASKGITGMTYTSASGRVTRAQVADAVRRSILTSMGQVAGRVQLQRASEWGNNLMEVSSHIGARPEHALWQGRVYSVNGGTPEYPNLAAATGYGNGTGAGLMGYNCRHVMFPFFADLSEPAQIVYNEVENDKIYQVTQEQRAMERGIRQEKRKSLVADAIGDKEALIKAQTEIKQREQDLLKFTETHSQTYQRERLQVYGFSRSEAARAVQATRR